ncbi:AAA family ATPase [Methanobacterium formicicum]|uniref:SMC domain-containing protein n=1 Tax=Methanobacterium formicicum TaxID=2162 RepID=A0A090JXA0_METFO|nr:AAA family ATPase [Methanobacterium formicicum]MDH2658953.1 AAA family ATPase [Methanobacterium formicicum]CEA14171.1 SMC domain-containing protein [Methanobacterium formicicum]
MRIQELEICNFRGIKELKLEPNGNNFLISGPNGSGKSAIVDAVDFLLTGDVSRMKGPGTKDIKLKEHAPHVTSDLKDCWVKAVVELSGIDEPVGIKREMSKPRDLICDDEYVDFLKPVQELASRGQHVLTRREILNFVTADANRRGKQIQNLLKINEVDLTRQRLVKVRNQLRNEFKNAQGNLETSKTHINSTVDTDTFDEDVILNFVNENRKILGGGLVKVLDSSTVKFDLQSPDIGSDERINLELLEKDLENLPDADFKEEIGLLQSQFKELYDKIQSDKTNPKDRLVLTQLGLKLAGDTCPLCDTSWDSDELEMHLSIKLKKLQKVREDIERLEELSTEISYQVKNKLSSISEVLKASRVLGLDTETYHLMVWEENLLRIEKVLDSDNYQGEPLSPAMDLQEIGNRIFKVADERYETTSPEQTAWDKLSRLEENLKYYEENLVKREETENALGNAEALHDAFIKSRDQVLDELYTSIKDRFVELYRQLHGSDEENFDALLTSSGAGVDFKVNFHGQGNHPPHALHSEGHQDSMGICLYLALAERLTQGYIDLIVLDDVMMSVDAPHRRQICHLLADFFKGKQFFITTHDQTWARQLRLEGVVSSKGMVELYDWQIDSGPRVNSQADMWNAIDKDLTRNDIPAAAAKLRRGSEEFFRSVCNSLRAEVKFRDNGQYELGDLLPPALKTYKNYLKKAKKAARSWDDNEEYDRLVALEKSSGEIFSRTNSENWAVNANVHYNKWADFTLSDFKPVVESFTDLYSVFKCDKCEGLLHVNVNANKVEAVRCNCNSFNWNLKGK